MTAFKDLNEFFTPGLVLPINGVEYAIQPPSATVGLWLQQMVVSGARISASQDEDEIVEQVNALGTPPGGKPVHELILGDAYQQMDADGVDLLRMKHCANTALIWIVMGEEAAERYWTTAGGAPGKSRNRAERRATSNRTGGAKKTRKAASTNGTSSRKSSSPARARSSRGATS